MSEQEVPTSVAQRIIIKFLANEGVRPAEILQRLRNQFGESTLSQPRVYHWHKTFSQGREKVENETHDRRPRTSITEENIRAVRDLIEKDSRGVILLDFLHDQRTINAEYYCQLLDQLKAAYRSKRRRQPIRSVILLHDNARPHTALRTREKLEDFFWETLEHPPYSPDLSPCDFHLFGPLKEALGGQRFDDDAAVETFVRNWLDTRPPSFYEDGINKLPIRWEKCVTKLGDYVEK